MPFIIPLIASILPFLLFPVELLLPFPLIIEELFKTLLLLPLVYSNHTNRTKLLVALVSGVLFAVSEDVLYVFNFISTGSFEMFFVRILATTLLHAGTMLVIILPALYRKRLIVVGFMIGVLLHYIFNELASKAW